MPSLVPTYKTSPTFKTKYYFKEDNDFKAFLTKIEAVGEIDAEKNYVRTFINTAKTDGWWSKKSFIHLYIGSTLATFLSSLKGPNPTNVNFVLADCNRTTGLLGNGTNKRLLSNVTVSTLSTVNNNLTCFAVDDFDTGVNSYLIGTSIFSGATRRFYIRHTSGNSMDLASHNNDVISVAASNSKGLYVINRNPENSYKAFLNNAQIGSTKTTAINTPLVNQDINIFSETGITFHNKTIGYSSAGDGLTSSELTSEYNAVKTFCNAIGRTGIA